MNFSKAIKALREELLLSQVELAELLGVSFATVNRWENGKSNPTKKELFTFKRYCKRELIDFKELEDER